MYAFGRTKDEARAELETLRKRVEEGLKDKLPQEVPVPAPPTKSTRGNKASWHNKPNYYSDPKISEEEFERRKNLPNGLQHHIVTTRTKPNKEVPTIKTTPLFVDLDDELPSPSPEKKSIPDLKDSTSDFVESELDAQLSAASMPAVAPNLDALRVAEALLVPPPGTEATTTSQVPCSSLSSVLTHSNQLALQPSPSKESSTASTSTVQSFNTSLDQSREQAGTSNHSNESAERRNALQRLMDFLSEEQRVKERIALIDRTMEDLHSERKALTDKVLSLKQKQYDVLLSTMPDHPFSSVNALRQTITTTETPAATESAQPMEESSPVHPIPHAASTGLEENGVHGGMEVVPSNPLVTVSCGTKRRMIPSSETKSKKIKRTTTSSTSNESKNAASPSVSSLTEESQDQTKEISTGKAQTGYSSTKVVEPTVPQPKVAELKVAERLVHPKVVKSKAADPKIVQTKKSTAANDTKTTQKPTDANSRSLENCRTSSRREESSTQKASPKLSKVNAQPFEAASKLPAPATDPNPAKDTAAATASTSTADCEIVSNHPILLPPHPTAVKCVDIHGPCAFTASEDGTVHIYDLDKNLLVKKISAHTDAVTWLYGISLKMSSEVLSNIKSTTEYLSHLTLVTGSEDKNIRQFALDSGALIHERFCNYTPTCESGTRTRRNLVGTKEGVILSYDTKAKSIMRIKKFQVNGEVICMKIVSIRRKGAIIIAVRQMEPVVFDLQTGNTLFKLASNIPNTSFYCISSSSRYVFCCDANKNMFKFDTHSDNIYQTETLPSAAVSSFYDGKRFLVLGCMDGVIRVMDIRHKQPYPMFTLPGQGLKTLACMEVVGDTIVGGSLNGEVFYCRLPNLEALRKASHY